MNYCRGCTEILEGKPVKCPHCGYTDRDIVRALRYVERDDKIYIPVWVVVLMPLGFLLFLYIKF